MDSRRVSSGRLPPTEHAPRRVAGSPGSWAPHPPECGCATAGLSAGPRGSPQGLPAPRLRRAGQRRPHVLRTAWPPRGADPEAARPTWARGFLAAGAAAGFRVWLPSRQPRTCPESRRTHGLLSGAVARSHAGRVRAGGTAARCLENSIFRPRGSESVRSGVPSTPDRSAEPQGAGTGATPTRRRPVLRRRPRLPQHVLRHWAQTHSEHRF